MPQRNALVEFKDAYLGYGSRVVVKGLNLTVGEGLTVLLGPNGSGKTTIMKAIFGSARVIKGWLRVNGSVTYAPAEVDGLINLTVLETVKTARRGYGWVSDEDAMDALMSVGIVGISNMRLSELSTGQKRLTMIARAIASNADLMLIDEPTANLDPGNRYRMIKVIRELANKHAVMVATHDVDIALTANQVVMIRDGNVIGVGEPGRVLTEERLTQLYGIVVKLIKHNDEVHVVFPVS
ncbi:ABC transporter ATP-binding protein [Caldivirga maquilingensis]|uniref:ABC transporter related n=1 Tax=Caldivirga maquilingensis (strain ATCC 700844 / DSM 13496 / JCM 10307 / IC-167) TaxID=397948 RepID=A8MDX8_CALMQ|nr:ABC transporter ATP-binding protein [Caldivirga maquilingensis]ABW01984.1 ABC transporter related [Caldivirga maquilingensis IC-167]